ncbi:MAG: mandelate racemase/muconate lactonizing enzyme family protein [Bryobacteraceae bacterium]|nr:mandelate racemase/muconate lactonizing enzyme family protein [Bryobacteraceae bacterium]
MRRRAFLPALALPLVVAARAAPSTKITRIETFYWQSRDDADFWPHWTWIRVHTDSGHFGIGETYPYGETEASLIHTQAARFLMGRDPTDIERIWADMYHQFDYRVAGGTEMRVISAVDLALWDLTGKLLDAPVYRLIGGKSNPSVRIYNTCFPHKYDFNKEPEQIMREVKEAYGVQAIKIWPFDGAARRNQRQFITDADIDAALFPLRKLRENFGSNIEILLEFHSNWNLTSAIRIAKAVEPYRPMWLEDMLMPGNFHQYRQLAEATPIPLTIGERMGGRMAFQQLLETRAAKYVMFDVCWCGGLSEARKIAAMAETYQLPIAPHTAGGPLLFYASTHLTTAATNVWIQESCQRFYEKDWPAMLANPIVPRDGVVTAPDLPGFGMQVKPEVWDHPKVVRRVTEA